MTLGGNSSPIASAALCLVLLTQPAAAQNGSATLRAPRPFGYLVGDVIRHEVEITSSTGFRLDPASAPRPGSRTYWLDLRSSKLEELSGQRYRLSLEYQTFYAALETRRMEIPGFDLILTDGASRSQVHVPAWPFLASPLREIIPPKGEGWTYLRPDVLPAPLSKAAEWRLLIASALAAVLSLAALAYDRARAPFHRRQGRPFAKAAWTIAKTLRSSSGETAYRSALLTLHRAFDAAAGRRVLAGDIVLFLHSRPAYLRLEPGVERFFAASRLAFFAEQTPQAMELAPLEDLVRLSAGLRAAERRAR